MEEGGEELGDDGTEGASEGEESEDDLSSPGGVGGSAAVSTLEVGDLLLLGIELALVTVFSVIEFLLDAGEAVVNRVEQDELSVIVFGGHGEFLGASS